MNIYIYRAGICSIQYLANQKTVKTQIQNMQIHWLVVEPYPSEKWWSEFVSWDDDIPNIMGKIIHPCSKPPTSIIIDLLSPYKDILSPIICRFIIKVIVFFMFLPKKNLAHFEVFQSPSTHRAPWRWAKASILLFSSMPRSGDVRALDLLGKYMCVHMCVYIYIYICVCVCVW